MDYRADGDPIPPIGGNPPGCPVATVTIDPPDGSVVLLPTFVVLTTNIAGAAIYYTLDGSEPTPASNLYRAPFSFDSLGNMVKAVAIVPGCAAGAVSTATYQQVTDSSFDFGYLCATGDHVGTFGEFAANGQANDYQFVLQMTLANNKEILSITILQTEADGVWDSGQSWATKEYITPLGVPFHTYPLVLIDQSGPTQLFTAYQTTLGTITDGTYEWRMWGQPFTTLHGYFMLLIELADGTLVKKIISTICTDPPPPCVPPEFTSVTVVPTAACTGDTVEVFWTLSGTLPTGLTVDGNAVTPALSGSSLVVLPSVPYTIVVTAVNGCGNDADAVTVADGCAVPMCVSGSLAATYQFATPAADVLADLQANCGDNLYFEAGSGLLTATNPDHCEWRGSLAIKSGPSQAVRIDLVLSGANWDMNVTGFQSGHEILLWSGFKSVGLTPIGSYTRNAGCLTSPGFAIS